jgi:hypothetical protein
MLSSEAQKIKDRILKCKDNESIDKILYENEDLIGELLLDKETLEYCNKYNPLTDDEIYSHNVYLRKKK